LRSLKAIFFTCFILLGCDKSVTSNQNIAFDIQEQASSWNVNNHIDKFTNEDLSTASIDSNYELISGKMFERTYLRLTVNKVRSKKNELAFFTFGNERTEGMIRNVQIMPKCHPKCDVFVKFDGGSTEVFTFKTASPIRKMGKIQYTEFNNKLSLYDNNLSSQKLIDKFVNSFKVEIRFPIDSERNIDYLFNIDKKLNWNPSL
jgi:hypothetical protein